MYEPRHYGLPGFLMIGRLAFICVNIPLQLFHIDKEGISVYSPQYMDMRKIPMNKQCEAIELYESGLTCKEVGKIYDVTDSTVSYLMRKVGTNRPRRKHVFTNDYFDVIDTEDKAYWLGFLYADGNVFKTSLTIALSRIDKEHLHKFASTLSANIAMQYRKSNDSYRVVLNSKQLVNSLIKHGVVPAKSLTIRRPQLDSNLIRHFYRGYFDGDGWISSRVKGKQAVWSIGIVSGSKEFVTDFLEWLRPQATTKAKIVERKRKNAFQVAFEGNVVAKEVIHLLYSDCTIYLDRKMNLARKAL